MTPDLAPQLTRTEIELCLHSLQTWRHEWDTGAGGWTGVEALEAKLQAMDDATIDAMTADTTVPDPTISVATCWNCHHEITGMDFGRCAHCKAPWLARPHTEDDT